VPTTAIFIAATLARRGERAHSTGVGVNVSAHSVTP
jgi:hypothetical protein